MSKNDEERNGIRAAKTLLEAAERALNAGETSIAPTYFA
jgi:hypothetical protein